MVGPFDQQTTLTLSGSGYLGLPINLYLVLQCPVHQWQPIGTTGHSTVRMRSDGNEATE